MKCDMCGYQNPFDSNNDKVVKPSSLTSIANRIIALVNYRGKDLAICESCYQLNNIPDLDDIAALHLQFGLEYIMHGAYDKARDSSMIALSMHRSSTGYLILGLWHDKIGEINAAIDCYKQALA
jgi:Tfp pilus assembly protein PilF